MAKLSIPYKTWVLVGDGEKVLIFENTGFEDAIDLRVIDMFEDENPPTREQGADRPGRMPDATAPDVPGERRSGIGETDWHRLEKERFAHEIANRLYKAAHRNKFEKLVLIAPPVILGELRKTLHKEVATRVVGEVDKDLTHHPVHKIESILKAG